MARRLAAAAIIARANLTPFERPDRLPKAMLAMRPWGTTLAGVVAAAAARYPDRVAVHDDVGSTTYRELWSRVQLIAGGLATRGVDADARVGLLCRNHRGFVESLVAVSATGADVVLLNTGFAGPQLADVVEQEDIGFVIHDDEFADLVSTCGARALDESALDELSRSPERVQPRRTQGRMVILTSGTTGRPKGAARGNDPSAVIGVAALLERIPFRVGDTQGSRAEQADPSVGVDASGGEAAGDQLDAIPQLAIGGASDVVVDGQPDPDTRAAAAATTPASVTPQRPHREHRLRQPVGSLEWREAGARDDRRRRQAVEPVIAPPYGRQTSSRRVASPSRVVADHHPRCGSNCSTLSNERVGPTINEFAKSENAVTGRRSVDGRRREIERRNGTQASRRALHLWNLPAGSDGNRLLEHIARLERRADLRNVLADRENAEYLASLAARGSATPAKRPSTRASRSSTRNGQRLGRREAGWPRCRRRPNCSSGFGVTSIATHSAPATA